MDNNTKKLMLLDGMSLINRAFYALPPFTTKGGVPTNAILGFLNIYFKLMDEEQSPYVAVAFDLPAPTFRHQASAEYKATRKPFPDDLKTQVPILKQVLEAMNIPQVSLEGYEADDVMGTLAIRAEKAGFAVTIVSGDRDLLQMASKAIKIRIPKTSKGQTTTEDWDEDSFIAQMGITPTQFIDMKALMGDASDNIPGVAGIGEKTALKIIQDYKDIEAAIKAAEADETAIKPKKAAQNLKEYAEDARLSKFLATIATDVPIDVDLEDLKLGEIYNDNSFEIMSSLELKSILKKFPKGGQGQASEGFDIKFEITNNPMGVLKNSLCAFHIAKEGKNILGVAITQEGKSTFTPSSGHMASFFESDLPKVGFDTKNDIHHLEKLGITINNLKGDLLLGGYLLNDLKDGDGVADLSLTYLKEALVLPQSEKDQLSLLDDPKDDMENMAKAAIAHASAIYSSWPVVEDLLDQQGLSKLFYEMEMPLLHVLADMESHGVLIDTAFINQYGAKLTIEINRLTEEIYSLAGQEFNINSPKQLAKVLFEDLGLKGGKKTKTGYSTNVDVLQKLAKSTPIAAKILEYRTFAKLKSTYVDGLLSAINPATGRIHTTFKQALTATGRLSSIEPNLQNIPIRTSLGRELRQGFIAPAGHVFIDADYSQIELRILAELSGDETFIKAFAQGQDIHRITASRVFDVDLDEVTDHMRYMAKAVNFGIVYGISSFSLAEDISVSVPEAEAFIQSYLARYGSVKSFMDKAKREARLKGYAETIYGRKRAIPELASSNFVTRNFGERAAMNMPVQGSAADIIKIAMIKLDARLKGENMASRLILQIHDELLLEVPESEIEQVSAILKEEMENAVDLSVKMTADISVGKNWYETK
ncbi:MAG: DNA polymerase I [Defluviitaleaceae bacterium]|nr:DNA polymerase I [Defluviitaleaceae bacterium]